MGDQEDTDQNSGGSDGPDAVLEQVLQRLREVNERLEDMTIATRNRDVIGQAKGILMERYGITAQQASALLISAHQHNDTDIGAVAEALVTSRNLPGTS